MTTAIRLDGSWRRVGSTLFAGSPLRLFRLSAAGQQLAERVERGEVRVDELAPAQRRLVERWIRADAVHPLPAADAGADASVTLVTPALGALPDHSAVGGPVHVVVDDASAPPLVTDRPGVTVVRRARRGGPAAARNDGLAWVGTPYVAFVDVDVHGDDGWWRTLVAHLDADPSIAAVAPRVSSVGGRGWLAGYEQRRSPLDLGPYPGVVRPGGRLSYVPSAALVARVDALRALGGFDTTMRFGEDVDLVWRLAGAGWTVRYEPEVVVRHDVRPSWRRWIAQRADYGTAAAPLAARHGRAVAPLRGNAWSAMVVGGVATGHVVVAGGVVAWTAAALRRRLPDVPSGESLRLVALGHWHALRGAAQATRRAWLPIAVVAGVACRRLRPWLLWALLVEPLIRTRRPLEAATLVVDEAAYCAGVWRGCVRWGHWKAVLPHIVRWPAD